MDITLRNIKIKDLVNKFKDDNEMGVVGYGGNLNIRPAYQREFIYEKNQQQSVINSIMEGFPLNIMYWLDKGNNTFELLDGQQRTLSICKYYNGDFSITVPKTDNVFYYQNLPEDMKKKFLNYELSIYVCRGEESETLEWFKTINIAGAKLTNQELRNAVYHGSFLEDAKKYFSKRSCGAFDIGKNYISGTPIRQDYLETAIKWINNNDIEDYMNENRHKQDSKELQDYFKAVIKWIKKVFPEDYNKNRSKYTKKVNWGYLYNNYKDEKYDADYLEGKIKKLIENENVTNNSGIYNYLLTDEEKHLSLRSFHYDIKVKVFEKQKGICVHCGKTFEINEMEADHIKPWHKGGRTTEDNCQLLCKNCNQAKGGK